MNKENKTNYWRIAPGQAGFLWIEQRNNGCIAVGWNETGDLKKYKTKEDFEKEFLRIWGKNKKKSANILWQFYKDIKKGDKLLINSGEQIFGIGTFLGEYRYNEKLSYRHSRPIRLELNFWEPTNARYLGLSEKAIGKICGLKPTVSRLEESEWKEISEKLHKTKNPFKGIMEFEGLSRSPKLENEVIVLFGKLSPILRMKIEAMSTPFPDALLRVKRNGKWITQKCEFELYSSGFRAHIDDYKKDPQRCDMLVCWEHDWKGIPKKVQVIELRKELEKII